MCKLSLLLTISAATLLSPVRAYAQDPFIPRFERKCYDDKGLASSKNNEGATCFDLGERAFADAIGNFADEARDVRRGKPLENFRGKPSDAVKAPQENKFYSLGLHGEITLRFTDNVLVDREGPDLKIFTDGTKAELANVSISTDGIIFHFVGQTKNKKNSWRRRNFYYSDRHRKKPSN